MKRIIQDLRNHIRSDFVWKKDGLILLLISVLIFLNYYFNIELILLAELSSWFYLLYFIILYPSIYYVATFIKSGKKVFTKSFLAVSGTYVLALSVSSGFIFYREFIESFPLYEQYYLRNILSNFQGVFWIFIPLIIIYYISERKHLPNFYGLSIKRHNFKPYLFLILLMLPLIVAAVYLPGFLDTYPTLKVWKYESVFGLSRPQMSAIYEFFYLSDFIRVETLFRGALIIGVARFLGKDSIMIMAALYCVLHFNKPLGETISSIFGGYLLGTIAYYQKNIVGGCIVHAGIAGLMELIAAIAWSVQ
ncbi:hypothetical protein N8Z47_05110 [Salibacteraceae bacterium]|nr:hypothetical protein [Salibacteraceae bacterium]